MQADNREEMNVSNVDDMSGKSYGSKQSGMVSWSGDERAVVGGAMARSGRMRAKGDADDVSGKSHGSKAEQYGELEWQ